MKLFGTDGIRGIVGKWPIVPEFFLNLGYAVGKVLSSQIGETVIFIGRDTRQSGSMLKSAFIAGGLSSGAKVIDVDVIPTPGIAWLVKQLGGDIGAVISASHNPADQNGIKFFNSAGHKLSEVVEHEVERLVQNKLADDLHKDIYHTNQAFGHIRSGDSMLDIYSQSLLAEHSENFLDGIKVVIDCANGATYHVAPEVISRAGARVISIHASPTGVNINNNSGSELVRRDSTEIHNLITHHDADFGLAFDGDGDRVIFIDELGNVVDGDHMLGLLATYLDDRQKLLAHSVVTTTMGNNGLRNFLDKSNLNFYETPVGDKYVVKKLIELRSKKTNSESIGLGGEQSGHILLMDNDHITGDGIRTSLFVIKAYLESGADSFSEFASIIEKTPQIIVSADIGNGPRLGREALDEMANQILMDERNLTRLNLRYSGTEPKFRIMMESNGQKKEKDLAEFALVICNKVQTFSGNGGGEIDILNCTHGGVISLES